MININMKLIIRLLLSPLYLTASILFWAGFNEENPLVDTWRFIRYGRI